jgi:SWIM zinc finger
MATQVRCARRILPVRLEEATVLSRAVCPCEMLPKGLPGLVSINSKVYLLAYNATLPEVGEPIIHGYRLTCTESYKTYDVPADMADCSCPDFLFRRGTITHPACKHILGIRLWREAGKVA